MPMLVISPDDDVREGLRVCLEQRGGSLRARTYAQGLVLAEQQWTDVAIVWSSPGANAEVIETVRGLRRTNRDMRIVVATPKFTKTGTLALVEALQVDAYVLDGDLGAVVADACGVPAIIEREQTPPTSHGGSSAAFH